VAGFCEIKLAEPLDNSLLGEHLPSRRIFIGKDPIPEIKLSVLYSRTDIDFKRIKRSKKHSILYNSLDYHPNYYEKDIITTSKANYDSLDTHRDNILPFSEYKDENNKKLRTFNTTQHNARFVANVNKTLGTEGTVYFNGPEPNVFNDIDFLNLPHQILEDPFEFAKINSTKLISNMDYPYYVNNYTINKMGSAIYPFNLLEEIQISHLTIKNIKGVFTELNTQDARKRNNIIETAIEVSNTNMLEAYNDEEINDLLISEEENIVKKYLTSISNNEINFSVDQNNILRFNTLTQHLNYISEEENLISPFKEDQSINGKIKFDYTDRVNISDSGILSLIMGEDNLYSLLPKDNIQFMTSGKDVNYEISAGVDSIAFLGLMD